MKQKNNLVNQINNKLSQMNNNIRDKVQNELVVNIVRVLLIIYCSFIVPMLNENQLSLVNNQFVRFIWVAVIVYISFIDIVSAILLSIALVLTLHRSGSEVTNNNNKGNNKNINDVSVNTLLQNLDNKKEGNYNKAVNNIMNQINQITNNKENFEAHENKNEEVEKVNTPQNLEKLVPENNVTNTKNVENVSGVMDSGINGESLSEEVKKQNEKTINDSSDILGNNLPQALDNNPVNNLQEFNASNNQEKKSNLNLEGKIDNNLLDKINSEQPASETLTDSILRAQGAERNENAPQGFTTEDHLYAIQENAVPGADIMHQVQTFKDQHSTQNLGQPMGHGAKRYHGHRHVHEKHPNLKHAMLRNENL